jgi:Glycerate kinase family
LLEGCPIVISRTLLIAARPFGARLEAERVAGAIGEGLLEGGWEVDPCPLDAELHDAAAAAIVRSGKFEARMRGARAVVIAEPRLDERTLAGTVAFEIATRARQGGVPAYAVTGENDLDSFDARILDLQTILRARTHRSLTSAGRKLAGLV